MKNKVVYFIISMLIGGLAGGLIGILSTNIIIPPEFTALPLYMNIILVIFTYILAVGIHELGHAYSFTRNGIHMRAVVVTFFFFMKENGQWKLRFRPNTITAIGGIAVPDAQPVKNSSQLIKMQQAYAKAIIAGPITSILLWGGVSVISVLIMLNVSSIILKSSLFTISVALTIITIFLLGTSFIKNEVAIGDFPAYKLAKNNRFFVAMQLYQYALFSSDHEQVRRENDFLRRTLVEDLKLKLEEQNTHIYTLGLIDQLIVEYLSGQIKELPQVIWDYVNFLRESPERFSKLKKSELVLSVYFHILRLMYINDDTKEKALDLYSELKKEIKPNTKMRKYLFKQTDHVFDITNNEEFLRNTDTICTSPAHGIWKNFDGYFVDEIKINESILKLK